MKRLLITGASGFIGRNLKEYFAKKDDEYCIICPTHKELDLCNEKSTKVFFQKNSFDVIVHAACTNTFVNNKINENDVVVINMKMFTNIIRNVSDETKVIYYGSGAEYSKEKHLKLVDEDIFGEDIPSDSYGFAKYLMRCMTEQKSNVYELCLFGVFGKYEEHDRRFISNVIKQALTEHKIHINRHCYYDYLWIGDLCCITEHFINHNMQKHIYNICTGKRRDLYDIACDIKKVLIDKKLIQEDLEILIGENEWGKEYTGSPNRFLSEVHYDYFDFKECISEMVNWINFEVCIMEGVNRGK